MHQIPKIDPIEDAPKVVGIQERKLGRTVIRTYRTKVDLDILVPNPQQPRLGPKEDEELQRQIEANEGIFEPLLVEPHPDLPGRFRIIDGDRRWTNSQVLVAQGREQFRLVPIEVTDRVLSNEERLRVWIYIHRQRKEWDAKEKEMVAYSLVDLVGRAGAASILGITVRELDKLVEIFELSEKFTGLKEPGAAITWSRELLGVSKSLLSPPVIDAVVRKVNQKRITNSKDLRKLRQILRDPVAHANFLTEGGDLETASLRLSGASKSDDDVATKLDSAVRAMESLPWTTLAELRGKTEFLDQLNKAQALIASLKKALSD